MLTPVKNVNQAPHRGLASVRCGHGTFNYHHGKAVETGKSADYLLKSRKLSDHVKKNSDEPKVSN